MPKPMTRCVRCGHPHALHNLLVREHRVACAYVDTEYAAGGRFELASCGCLGWVAPAPLRLRVLNKILGWLR